jgi:hypothetical protein
MLKNYGLPSLLWVLPLAIVIGLFRLVYLTLTALRGAIDPLAAWAGTSSTSRTISRRVRTVGAHGSDRHLRRFMESTGVRLPRWFGAAGQIFDAQREIEEQDEDESVSRRLRDRTASLVGSHPVLVASMLGTVVAAVAFRQLLGPEPLHGGALAMFPGSWRGFFAELASGYRTTLLGGTLAASPSLERWARFVALVREHGDRAEAVPGGRADLGHRHALSGARAHHRPSRSGGPGGRLLRTLGHGAVELLGRAHTAPGGALRPPGPVRAA